MELGVGVGVGVGVMVARGSPETGANTPPVGEAGPGEASNVLRYQVIHC